MIYSHRASRSDRYYWYFSFYYYYQCQQGQFGKPLIFVDGGGHDWAWIYHYCAIPAGTDLRNISTTSWCYEDWMNALTKIAAVSDSYIGPTALQVFERDPWGSPYLLDLNEGETSAPTPGPYDYCRPDILFSAGADGVISASTGVTNNYDPVTKAYTVTFGGDDFGAPLVSLNPICVPPVIVDM